MLSLELRYFLLFPIIQIPKKYLPFEFTFDYRKCMGIHITQTNTLQWKSSHAKEDQKRTQIEMLIIGLKRKSFQLICRYLLMYWIKVASGNYVVCCDEIFCFIMVIFYECNLIHLLLLSFWKKSSFTVYTGRRTAIRLNYVNNITNQNAAHQ